MITEIGIVAGDIWHHLEEHKGSNLLENIIREIDKSRDIILMSIGWLAREGHIIVEGEAPTYNVRLRK